METYALFEDVSTSRIVFDFFDPDPKDDPVRLAFPDIEDIQVRNSAKNGCLSGYQVLSKLNYLDREDRFFPSCQFAEGKINISVQGGSAGLAFCLKFVQEACRMSTEKTLDYSIAATGVISDGTREARVERVKGINTKLVAAVEILQTGDKLFYPSENEAEVSSSIKKKAAHKGIQLIPVSTVDQAVREALPDGNGSARVRRLSPRIKTILSAAIAVATGLAIYSIYHPAPGADSLNNPLRLEIDFHYWDRTTLKKDTVPVESAASPRDEIVLRSGDYYRFSLTTSDSCYLYVYQIDSQGKVDRMPDPVPISEPGFLEPGITYYLPGEFSRFYLDEQTGRETIYFVGFRRRSKDLEETYQRFLQAPEMEKDGLRRALLEKIETRTRAGSEGVKGVFYAVFTFRHDPRMQTHNAPD